ncbi:hypothetical protein [Chryseobacterium sp. M5A1_1a]
MKSFFFKCIFRQHFTNLLSPGQMNLERNSKVQLMAALEYPKAEHHYTGRHDAVQLLL